MQDTVYSRQRARFGAFEADLRAGELWKSGRKKKLTGQPFAVLAILLERPGEVISREELQKRLWPDTFVDVDHNLNTAINKIREALNDSSEHPQFVETLPRRGYRFIAAVENVQAATPGLNGTAAENVAAEAANGGVDGSGSPVASVIAVEPVAAAAQAAASKLPTWARVAAWSAIAGAALVLAYFLRPEMPPPSVSDTAQLTHDGAEKLRGVGSPPPPLQTDGSRLYFVETAEWSDKLMQVSIEGGETVRINVPIDFIDAAGFAPDQPDLVVSGPPYSPEGLGIWSVPIPAGQPRRIGNLLGRSPTWSPDGTALYYRFGRDIFRANADGSEPRKILTTDGEPFWLRFSPDGRLLRFSVFHRAFETMSLWEARPDGSHLRQLLAGWNGSANDCCGNWTSDGKYFIFQSNRQGVANLWAIREKGDLWRKTSREPVQLTVGEINSEAPLPSKDGKKLFFIAATRHGELVRYDAKTQKFTPYLPGLSAEGVAFSPDGKKVAYVTYPEGVLWESRTDGSERRQLSFPPMQVGLPRWSPDGTRIAFSSRAPGKAFQVYIVSGEGEDPELLTSGDSDKQDVAWSPDGNSLMFGGDAFVLRQSKKPGIHILNLKTRQITDVPGSEGEFSPRWSPDGRYLLAMSVGFDKLVLYDFAQRKWEDLVKMQVTYPAWSHDGKCISFADAFDPKLPVYRVCLSDRKIERIVDLSEAGKLAEGHFGWWTGLAPDDSILATRDIGIQEIYALDTKFR